MSIGLFDKNLLLLQRSMDLSVKRNAMISSNLANQETPGFRAQDLVFEDQLDRALNSDQPGPLKTSHSRHFDGAQREPLETVEGQQINSFNPDPGMDGNTVNLDKEMAKLAENQLMFQAVTKAVNWKFRMLKSAITEGGR
ncbi:MAG: flagellar basal-body rod protein FlgB [Candidatus Lambdaproteobacteria bacterium RIFOXYD12_FULL_49_8]|uniref:Flagellar basal body rod protein FlgB n=1 Tax=Candidatus Lambdaproteobacteria bacterium RIFOXYD2_FULL_50_16 TaxID=1817772 RepID=A0A1F6G9J0_9PROT|nr:MAG: flagellar basal-body rod protein FlgB [Candidatus Lambdaproteobacteria bacterium RIFOXYD2_FULL_50_16]OGG96779.1 MAG: flagellar basal-body rod protein FlgB [Candidatus Lambdaproteobacteria bacterium RIFOXYD12_FULL_49_8]